MRFHVLAALAVLAAGPLAAANAPAPANAGPPKKICRKVENNTGSHLAGSGRVCRTAEQWAKYDNAETLRNTGSVVEKGSKDDQ